MRNSISPFDRWGNWDPEMLRKFPNITRLGSRITLFQIQADWFQNPCSKPLIDTTWFCKSSIRNTLPNTWHVGMEQLLKGLTEHTWAKVAYTMKRGKLTCWRQWYYFIWLTSFENNHEAATGACTDNFQAAKKDRQGPHSPGANTLVLEIEMNEKCWLQSMKVLRKKQTRWW